MIRRAAPQAILTPELLAKLPEVKMADVHAAYIDEKLRRQGSNISRPAAALQRVQGFFGPERNPQTIRLDEFEAFEDLRYSQGVKAPTVRKELVFHQAAMHFGQRRGRLLIVPPVEMPSGEVTSTRRPATEQEFALLLRKGVMSYRLRMFFRMAYWTGHRSQAIEQLTWDRVDLARGLIDFNLPGARRTNKRRNEAFPIPDGLRPFLEAALARRAEKCPADPYVITAGDRGGASSTYVEAKAAWRSVGIDVKGLARHCIRATFVTERLRKGKSPDMVAQLIKDSPQVMSKHYAKFVVEDLREVANG